MIAILILLLIGSAMGIECGEHPAPCPYATRDDLLPCITRAFDIDNNGAITVWEIDFFLASQPPIDVKRRDTLSVDLQNRGISIVNPPWECLPLGWKSTFLNGTKIVSLCDTNADVVLDLTDWGSPQSCLKSRSVQDVACKLCEKCLTLAPTLLRCKK